MDVVSDSKAGVWKRTLRAADAYYQSWETRFNCELLEEFFEGYQHGNETDPNYRAYVINLFFSSIESKIPSMIFQTPVFQVTPRPWEADFEQEQSFSKARLKEDVLNSWAMDEKNDFAAELEQVAYDVFFRFGIMEVGYSAQWYENPSAEMPEIDQIDKDENEPKVIRKPKLLLEDERVYAKAIDPRHFRVGGGDYRRLNRCDWVGYYDFYKIEDIKAVPGLKNLDMLAKDHSKYDDKYAYKYNLSEEDREALEQGTLCKLWTIWDNRSKKKLLLSDVGYVLKSVPFDELPLRIFAPIPRSKRRSIYPIPMAFNWVSPQMEINESREMMRVHRRRFKRAYLIQEGRIEETELVKVLHGGDGAFAKVNGDIASSIQPLPMATMDPVSRDTAIVSKEDFNIISATTAEQQLMPDRTTATQATIVNQKSELRDNWMRAKFATFICQIARLILKAHSNIVEPFWIKRFADTSESMLTEMPELEYTWQQIISDEIEGDDFEVALNVSSLSPISNEEEKKKLFEVLSVLNQYPQLSFSPMLIREVLDRIGYRNAKVANHLIQIATMQMIGMANMAQQNGMAQQNVAKMTPDGQEQVQNQITNQVGRV